jgi:ABC-type Fe3+ transport system substrate-binding protein
MDGEKEPQAIGNCGNRSDLKGSPNPEGARRLVDYLLSAEVEKRLAELESHQVPLNPEVKATLPPRSRRPGRSAR